MSSRVDLPRRVTLDWLHRLPAHITLRQLRDLELAARQRAVKPPTDEQAWKDTEIDVRRVVL